MGGREGFVKQVGLQEDFSTGWMHNELCNRTGGTGTLNTNKNTTVAVKVTIISSNHK